jgi:formate dehydrogenase
MSILLLVRNFIPAHEVTFYSQLYQLCQSNDDSQMIQRGDWQVSDIARSAFDLEGKVVGTIGAGRIGFRVLQRLLPFDCKELLYYDYSPLPAGSDPFISA